MVKDINLISKNIEVSKYFDEEEVLEHLPQPKIYFNNEDIHEHSSFGELTLLLGIDRKYLFKDFSEHNIQLTNTWYFDNLLSNTSVLYEYLQNRSHINIINIIGTSKSCTGAMLIANKLSQLFPNKNFRLFLSSPYTRYDSNFYKKLGHYDSLPPSLIKVFEDETYSKILQRYQDIKNIIVQSNIHTYVVFPRLSPKIEGIMAAQLADLENVTFLPLPLTTHNVIHLFWKKVAEDRSYEVFEGKIGKLPKPDVEWIMKIQNNQDYSFNIYNLVYDTDNFINRIKPHL